MSSEPTHWENNRRVTDWRKGDDGLWRRWVYDARNGHECWDEEISVDGDQRGRPSDD